MNTLAQFLRGFWALLWRSVVLLPFAFGLFALFCYAGMGLVALPFAAGFFIWTSQWWLAAACVALWIGSFVCVRRIWRWERSDDSSHRGRI